MAHTIILEKDFENYVAEKVYIVTSTKLAYLKKNKVKYRTRIKAGTGVRKYEFDQPKKEKEEEE